MAGARLRDSWARDSLIMTLIANANRDPRKGRPFKPADFNPFFERAKKQPQKIDAQSLSMLRDKFKGMKADGKSGRCKSR